MLILVGVTINVSLNGGLFTKASEASKQMQVEADRETLLSAVVAAIGYDGKVVIADIELPTGWTGSNGTYTSPKGNSYTVDENGKITEGEKDELGEYYLRMLKVMCGIIEPTEEEMEEINAVLNNLMVEGKLFYIGMETGIENYYEEYYYFDGYIIYVIADERGEERVIDFHIMTSVDEQYNKISAIFKEKIDILGELRTLLIGYTYTEALNDAEFEEYVENELEREFDFYDWRLNCKSSIDDNITHEYSIGATMDANYIYTIDRIQSEN